MSDIPELPPEAFEKADPSPDGLFYGTPRLVAHIDERALGAVTALYRRLLPPGGVVLDLMSSWISHLPADIAYREVLGVGMNAAELDANPRLDRRVVRDLNIDPTLPFADTSVDATTICVSIQYLQRPVAVLREVRRMSRPDAPLVITFSDRCFPTKAVAIWGALDGADRARLVAFTLARAGFDDVQAVQVLERDRGGDPLWSVVGYRRTARSAM